MTETDMTRQTIARQLFECAADAGNSEHKRARFIELPRLVLEQAAAIAEGRYQPQPFTYRAYMLLLYFFALMPFVMALSMDGWGVREISMHRFSSQSPMKHRMGVAISNANLVFVAVWMVLPTPIPSVFAPAAILAMGVASWIWLSNLQKRI